MLPGDLGIIKVQVFLSLRFGFLKFVVDPMNVYKNKFVSPRASCILATI